MSELQTIFITVTFTCPEAVERQHETQGFVAEQPQCCTSELDTFPETRARGFPEWLHSHSECLWSAEEDRRVKSSSLELKIQMGESTKIPKCEGISFSICLTIFNLCSFILHNHCITVFKKNLCITVMISLFNWETFLKVMSIEKKLWGKKASSSWKQYHKLKSR